MEFEAEFAQFTEDVQDEVIASMGLLREFGPSLSRPNADTLSGSRYPNMKELRFEAAGGVWRIAFAFDPERKAILLVGGTKSGKSQQRFYRALIRKADERYGAHLIRLQERKRRNRAEKTGGTA